MDIDEFVRNCLQGANPSPGRLTIPKGQLLTQFRNLRGWSESQGREAGFHLYWFDGRLTAGQQKYEGVGPSAVNLNTTQARMDPGYIGDCHTHPYRIKMGPEARIGPSDGDHDNVWTRPPANHPVALYFVISSRTVFLVVRRDFRGNDLVWTGEPDTLALTRHAYDPAFAEALGRARTMQETNLVEGLKAERHVWDTRAPEAAAEFREANLRHNIELANRNGYDFYAGEMDEAGKAAICQLDRLSQARA